MFTTRGLNMLPFNVVAFSLSKTNPVANVLLTGYAFYIDILEVAPPTSPLVSVSNNLWRSRDSRTIGIVRV